MRAWVSGTQRLLAVALLLVAAGAYTATAATESGEGVLLPLRGPAALRDVLTRVGDEEDKAAAAATVVPADLTETGRGGGAGKSAGAKGNKAKTIEETGNGEIVASGYDDTVTTSIDSNDGGTASTIPPVGYDARRPPAQKPVYVNVAFELKRLYGIDESHGTCSYSIVLMSMWADTRLAFDANRLRPGENYINLRPYDVWHPVIEPQGASLVRRTMEQVRLMPTGDVLMIEKLQVDAASMFDLSWFPFDNQRIPMEFQLYTYSTEQVILQLNSNWNPWFHGTVPHFTQGATSTVNIYAKPTWNIYGFDGDIVEFQVEGQTWSKAAVYLDVKRRYFYYMMAYFMPLVLITLTGNTAFYIDPQDNGSRIGVAMGSVLALVAMEYVMLSELPKAGYVMWIHIYIIGQFIMVCTPTLFAFITSHLSRDDNFSRKMDVQQIKPEEAKSAKAWIIMGCLFLLPTGYSSDVIRRIDNIGLVTSMSIFVVFNLIMFVIAAAHAY